MVDTETGEFTEKTLLHEGNVIREFYAAECNRLPIALKIAGAGDSECNALLNEVAGATDASREAGGSSCQGC